MANSIITGTGSYIGEITVPNHEFRPNDIIVFTSVGAGMNTNAMVYRMP